MAHQIIGMYFFMKLHILNPQSHGLWSEPTIMEFKTIMKIVNMTKSEKTIGIE